MSTNILFPVPSGNGSFTPVKPVDIDPVVQMSHVKGISRKNGARLISRHDLDHFRQTR
jgi:hypothetical protein